MIFTISFVFTDYGAHLCAETFLQAKSNNKWRGLDSVPSVSVSWQRPGDNHGGQPALYPAAALHCWCAPLASHLRCHRCDRLRWELTSNGQPHDHWHFLKTTFFFFKFHPSCFELLSRQTEPRYVFLTLLVIPPYAMSPRYLALLLGVQSPEREARR